MAFPEIIWKATDLSLGYAQQTVLHGIHLEVRSGEFWFCLGLNGAGKSTFLTFLIRDLSEHSCAFPADTP